MSGAGGSGLSNKKVTTPTTGHDMSHYWRLVRNEGGQITGTWWVTRPDKRGEQHVKPIDVTVWNEGRHWGFTLHPDDFTAFVRAGQVEPIQVRSQHSHIQTEVEFRLDEVAAAVLAAAAAPVWPEGETTTRPGTPDPTPDAAA